MKHITKAQALLLIENFPLTTPTLEPCYVVNWPLWFAWCEVQGRPADGSPHWTEYDVCVSCARLVGVYFFDLIKEDTNSDA